MQRKTFFILFCLYALGLTSITGQTPVRGTDASTLSKGILNGAAISLPKPAYPPAAKAVNAEGTVSVQVTIDEEGNVVSAKAVSGHPLLQSASVKAAEQAKFRPTLLAGTPVKVSGIIVYNFVSGVPQRLSLRQIGYALSLAENSQWWKSYSPEEIITSLSADWTDEREMLKNLETYLKNKEMEAEKTPAATASTAPKTEKTYKGESFKIGSENIAVGSMGVRATSGSTAPARFYKQMDSRSAEMTREIQTKIENRLTAEEKNLWSFRFGKLLGKTKGEINDIDKTRANILEINQLIQTSPLQFSESVLSKLREVSEAFQQAEPDLEAKRNLENLIESLSK